MKNLKKMLEFFVIHTTVYIIADEDYSALWKFFIKEGIKTGKKSLVLMEKFKSHVIMIYSIYIHGKEKMDKVMDEWKIIKNDDTVNELISQLSNTIYGNLIEELIFNEITIKNVIYMIHVCLELIRKIQYTRDHKLIREFLNDNPEYKIIKV